MMVAIHPSGDLTEADVIRRVADIAAFAADGISLYPKEKSTLGEDSTFFATIIRSPHVVGELFDPSKLIYLIVSIFYKSVATEQVYHTSIFFLISANIPEIPTAIELQQVGREYHGAVVDHHYTYDEEYHRKRRQ